MLFTEPTEDSYLANLMVISVLKYKNTINKKTFAGDDNSGYNLSKQIVDRKKLNE